jgi:outer membrane lipoprotein-sorting protein
MSVEKRERGHDPAARSGSSPHDGGDTALTAEDQHVAEALTQGLGRLRTARPGFQDELERRLLERLAEPARPWWRVAAPRPQARRRSSGLARLPRRSLLGLAAATALGLVAASLAVPMVGTPEASAREILEKAQASFENPVLAGVKSFHLTAKMWTNGGPRAAVGAPRELTTEQWFVAPGKMRSESRWQESSGKSVISGIVMNGGQAKEYRTDGATDVFMISMFPGPAVGAQGGTVDVDRRHDVRPGPPPATPAAGGGPGAPATIGSGSGVAAPEGGPGLVIAYATKDGAGQEGEPQVVRLGEGCPEPKRTGEATVAGRAVFVIEHDFRSCLPANAPAQVPARHINWVDQQTFLPLKMEAYDRTGALVDRYEVSAIQFDVDIADQTFTELPAGTSVREMQLPPAPPDGHGVPPAEKPAPR